MAKWVEWNERDEGTFKVSTFVDIEGHYVIEKFINYPVFDQYKLVLRTMNNIDCAIERYFKNKQQMEEFLDNFFRKGEQ